MKTYNVPTFGTVGSRRTAVADVELADANSNGTLGITVPANSLLEIDHDVVEVFNSGGADDAVTVGYVGALTAYVAGGDIDETSTGFGTKKGPYRVTTETELYFKHVGTGAAATTGRVRLFVHVTPLG
jgi:hypothetical protein